MSRALAALAALAIGCGSAEQGISGSTNAASCGACHTTEHEAWESSRLASSGTSPVFAALETRVASAWGASAAERCRSCHRPGFGGDHGIGCVACHSATGNLETRDGLLSVDPSAPVSGPFSDPYPTSAHGSRVYGFLAAPELCGTCHELTGPRLFHETTYVEYTASSAARSGATCISCHMAPTDPGPIATGISTSRPRKDHGFLGIDPPWGANADRAAEEAARSRDLLRGALELSVTRVRDGLDVSVKNRAGHAVPTGIAFLRDIHVDVELTDDGGQTASLPSVVDLREQPTSRGAPVALVTDADAVESHVLGPDELRSAHVDPPASVGRPYYAVVTLRARAIRSEVLDALGLASRAGEVPDLIVSEVRLH